MPLMPIRIASTPAYQYLDAQPPFGRVQRYRIDRHSGAVWLFKGQNPHTKNQIWNLCCEQRARVIQAMIEDRT